MLNMITTYGLLLLYFGLYFIAVYASSKCNSSSMDEIVTGKGEAGVLLNRLLAGILFLGIGSVHIIIISHLEKGMFTLVRKENEPVPYWLLITFLAVLAGSFSAFKKQVMVKHQFRFFSYSFSNTYIAIRILFLAVYEIFFRAVLLFVMIRDFGIAVAVCSNIFLYVLVHWYNKKERTGSVVMGLVLCAVSIYYHSVWPAVIIHAALALSHESILILHHLKFKNEHI